MEEIICEPVELSDQDLDKVAGGYPFSTTGFLNGFLPLLLRRHDWVIGAVFGNGSTVVAGTINVHKA